MGREFIDLFNEWSDSYDDTVDGKNIEYEEVFKNYQKILHEVANQVSGNVVEFGVGTGNLTTILREKGAKVTGIEPSPKMRLKALNKLGNVTIHDGDFINFPNVEDRIDGIVSSYAFHHLTDQEKEEAISIYSRMLSKGGKIVFADTIFENSDKKFDMIKRAEAKNHFNLAQDLKTEYYTTIPVLTEMLEKNGFTVEFTNMNDFVWIMKATKL